MARLAADARGGAVEMEVALDEDNVEVTVFEGGGNIDEDDLEVTM